MKLPTCCLAAFAISLCPAQVTLSGSLMGKQVTVTVARKKTDAGIEEAIVWNEKSPAGAVHRSWESTYRGDGALLRRVFSSLRERTRDAQQRRVARIDGAVAHVQIEDSLVQRSSDITLTRGTAVDPSAAWFLDATPKKGDTARFMSFDPEQMYWEEVTVTYGGREKLGGSKEGHLVTRKTARKTDRMLLDEAGLPLIWEQGRLRLVRTKS